MSHPKEGAQIK